MSTTVKPLPGAKITVDEDGRITFWHWQVTCDEPITSWTQPGLTVLDYLRDRLEAESSGGLFTSESFGGKPT